MKPHDWTPLFVAPPAEIVPLVCRFEKEKLHEYEMCSECCQIRKKTVLLPFRGEDHKKILAESIKWNKALLGKYIES